MYSMVTPVRVSTTELEEGLDRVVRSCCGRHWDDSSSADETGEEVVWWAGTL